MDISKKGTKYVRSCHDSVDHSGILFHTCSGVTIGGNSSSFSLLLFLTALGGIGHQLIPYLLNVTPLGPSRESSSLGISFIHFRTAFLSTRSVAKPLENSGIMASTIT
jgi:hypothetical protein